MNDSEGGNLCVLESEFSEFTRRLLDGTWRCKVNDVIYRSCVDRHGTF